MVSSLLNASSLIKNPSPPTIIPTNKIHISLQHKLPTKSTQQQQQKIILFHKSNLIAASLAIALWCNPANAGILSGFSGLESVPGPELPQIDFLKKFNDENQKKYAENDARFKESPLLKKLLEQSKVNREKNRQEIQDKYCLRGAEWGVGDCSADGMSPEDREKFIAMLKQKAGIE